MDEFTDLDKELAKLREELASQDDGWNRQFHFPASGDYWKRRLDEEKSLWDKKVSAQELEKKALQDKLEAQKNQIELYNRSLQELEQKITADSQKWEERLKTREAELLLEKNRLMWDEKVRIAEQENKALLGKINELNEKIGAIRNEQLEERDRFNENITVQKESFEKSIRSYQEQVEVLNHRSLELERTVQVHQAEYEKSRQEYEAALTHHAETIQSLEQEKGALEREKNALEESIEQIKKDGATDKNKIEQGFKELSFNFAKNLHLYLGPLATIVDMIAAGKLKKASWNIVSESVQRLENETELFLTNTDTRFAYSEIYATAVLLKNDDLTLWQDIAAKNRIKMNVLSIGNYKSEIIAHKPQVIVLSASYEKQIKVISNKWPFIPIIVFDEKRQKVKQAYRVKGIKVITQPCLLEEIVRLVDETASRSIAWPEFWDKIRIQKSYSRFLTMLVIGTLLATGVYVGKNHFPFATRPPRTLSAGLPYAQPTNMAFDGASLWVCDWFGQSIYRHAPDAQKTLVRIFQFPEKHITALTWIDGYLWSADPWNKKVYKHNADQDLTILSSYQINDIIPSGLAGDSRNLWSCDSEKAMIYRHKYDDALTIEAAYKSPGKSPSGLFFDGTYLWSIDSDANRIYCHNFDEALSVRQEYLAPGFEQKGFNLSGFVFNGEKMWMCSEKTGKLFEYDKTALKRVK